MNWKTPPQGTFESKVYEALGCIADDRIEISEDQKTGKIYSSSRNKFYNLFWDADKNGFYANDNSSFYKREISYTLIAFMMKIGKLPLEQKYSQMLKDIKWKDINQKYKNDFGKTVEEVNNTLQENDEDVEGLKKYTEEIMEKVVELNIEILPMNLRPPVGY